MSLQHEIIRSWGLNQPLKMHYAYLLITCTCIYIAVGLFMPNEVHVYVHQCRSESLLKTHALHIMIYYSGDTNVMKRLTVSWWMRLTLARVSSPCQNNPLSWPLRSICKAPDTKTPSDYPHWCLIFLPGCCHRVQ